MAKKVVEIKQTPGNDEKEREAISQRRSTPRRKSQRGIRDDRLTVLVPKSLHKELSMYATATQRSVGDIVNELLEDYLKDEERQDKIAIVRELYGE
ncbi:MAG: hypothetical protein IKP04_04705 [Candidatus Methanomethylophilaceae archaeon]|nr:hypothetical protein [Candidatus Methanomethylophilaceae archaeon]